jgi:hypothetical protein
MGKNQMKMINNFFRLNMPYGIARNENGEWIAFNREYNPLGVSVDTSIAESQNQGLWHKYKRTLSRQTLLSLAWHPVHGVRYDKDDNICQVWFYNDKTNPVNHPGARPHAKYWEAYMQKLYILAKWKLDK